MCGLRRRTAAPTSTILSRAEELTGVRLLVLHNLTYLERLVHGARGAIQAGRFDAYRHAILGGETPWSAAVPPSADPVLTRLTACAS